MTPLIQFGACVREHRERLQISQEELGSRSGLDRSYVGGVERGTRNISLLNMSKLALALRVPLADLFLWSTEDQE
jgi:transcriptional regulator with XRE-family HTH domain